MASNSEIASGRANTADNSDSSSDEECLASLKRKVASNRSWADGSYEDAIRPELLVKIEVEPIEEEEPTPLDYSLPKDKSRGLKKSERKSKPKENKIPQPKKKKSMPCPECDAEFETASDLKQHSISHELQTRHKCEVCGRCFSKAFGLRTHMRMHGERNMECPHCDAIFTSRNSLGRHMSYYHGKERCKICDTSFLTNQQLLKHIKSCHRDLPRKEKNDENSNGASAKKRRISFKKAAEVFDNPGTSSQDTIKTEDDSDVSTDGDACENEQANGVVYTSKREDISYPIQCAIVSKMHKGRTVAEVSEIYKITTEVINAIWEDRDDFVIAKRSGRNSMRYMNSILDAKILQWIEDRNAKNIQVTGKALMDIAEAFAKESGFVSFNGSKKWLDRFKTRYKITFRKEKRNRDYSNTSQESKWKKQFLQDQWVDLRNGFADDEIYTADEVGLYYNSSRGRIKKMSGKKYIHGFPKDRLSIFLCTNTSGSDKKKLLVCGTEDPLLHSCRSPDTLPVTYIRHAHGHFTTPMFEEYVKFWNRELQIKNKKVILILDRATIHSKLTLSHLKLVFVPWKAANSLMPMKSGIFNRFRDEYRRLFLAEKTFNVIRGIDRNITCLEALNMLEKAWDRTPAEVISTSFFLTGYDIKTNNRITARETPKVMDNDEEIFCTFLEDYDVDPYFADIQNLDNYLTVDDEFLTGQGSNGSVFGGNHRVVDATQQKREIEEILPLATDRPESDEVENTIVKSRAMKDLEIVRKYLQTNKTPYNIYCRFMDIEKFLLREPVNL